MGARTVDDGARNDPQDGREERDRVADSIIRAPRDVVESCIYVRACGVRPISGERKTQNIGIPRVTMTNPSGGT